MRHHAIMLVTFSIILLGSGCAEKQPCTDQIVKVPQKCVLHVSEYPQIENEQFEKGEELKAVKQAAQNYLKMKEYNDVLLEEIKICQ